MNDEEWWGMMKSYVGSETRIGEWGGETFRCAWSNCNLEEEDGDQQLAQIPVCGGKNNKIDMTIVIEIVIIIAITFWMKNWGLVYAILLEDING